jgi:ACR3 family arsenite efflux pump ArsB
MSEDWKSVAAGSEDYLTDGVPVYTVVQVAVNDLIMLVLFTPIVMFLCDVARLLDLPKTFSEIFSKRV